MVIKIPLFDIEEDNHIKSLYINGFNVIELDEDREDKYIVNYELNKMPLSEKEVIKLFSISKKCEDYYSTQYGESIIKVKCFKCEQKYFHTNELLHFVERKDLINYIKYCFGLKKILFVNWDNYVDNSNSLQKFDNIYFKNWKFVYDKTICKMCFLEVINLKDLFLKLKNIFCETTPQIIPNENKTIVKRVKKRMGWKKKKKVTKSKEYKEQKQNQINIKRNVNNQQNDKQNLIYDDVNHTIIIFKRALSLDDDFLFKKSKEEKLQNNNLDSIRNEINIEKELTHINNDKNNCTKKVNIDTINYDDKQYNNINNEIIQQNNQNKEEIIQSTLNQKLCETNAINFNLESNNEVKLSHLNDFKNNYTPKESNESYEQSETNQEIDLHNNTIFITNKHLMSLLCFNNNLLQSIKELFYISSYQNNQDKIQKIHFLKQKILINLQKYFDAFQKIYYPNLKKLDSYWREQLTANPSNVELNQLFQHFYQQYEIGLNTNIKLYNQYLWLYQNINYINR
jgi:hypothetical protein